MSKMRNCTEGNDSFDLLGTWTAAKNQAQADVAELEGKYPPAVVRQLLEALTWQNFWNLRK